MSTVGLIEPIQIMGGIRVSARVLGKRLCIAGLSAAILLSGPSGHAQSADTKRSDNNKRIARAFYEDLWFNNRTERYNQYMADTYIVHDTGDRKNVTEPAIEQKNIADFFWDNGVMSGSIDYQIAEGDLVATRWTVKYEPTTLLGRVLLGRDSLPIINVFRFENGKIVELWNHRHDIDTGQTIRFTLKGLAIGLLVALVPLGWAIALRRRLRRVTAS